MTKNTFILHSNYAPSGDQPEAIAKLIAGINNGVTHQTLKGVTGSGKTFTMANVIHRLKRPTLILAHNKTLAAQLYSEMNVEDPSSSINAISSILINISGPACRSDKRSAIRHSKIPCQLLLSAFYVIE
ncbi:hypothetical protein PTRA_b0482 [Pseudoalteromonas translucida KMM 520]|uniref:Helicase/UvrB N-terminal domain-containing protein n=1 Tax=Pseudoalteromonas translucida KMM 520 TaxID=1315283 RepID=A0A0U2XCJ4_9GAMM|nr:hypothetical protein PTRA_b0482 [Pseudoalteromonas translucida KMM 520]